MRTNILSYEAPYDIIYKKNKLKSKLTANNLNYILKLTTTELQGSKDKYLQYIQSNPFPYISD